MEEKKSAAEQKLSQITKGTLSAEEIDHLIENAVFILKQQIGRSMPASKPSPVNAPIGLASKSTAPVVAVKEPATTEQLVR